MAVFFGGLAIGGAIWSVLAPRSKRPLRQYGLLELGVGVSGGLYFALMAAYTGIYASLHGALGDAPGLLLAAKLLLAAGVLLPPAILMGGTLPLMSQYLVGAKGTLGSTGTLLYGVNTLGAASGALAAGFWLPAWLGFHTTYWVAIVASLAIGAVAWWLGGRLSAQTVNAARHRDVIPTREQAPTPQQDLEHNQQPSAGVTEPASTAAPSVASEPLASSNLLGSPKLIAAAVLSGVLALALEVLWTRMFQQVLQNSVYTYSVILVIFLAALSSGAFVARFVARRKVSPWQALAWLSLLAGMGALATPFVFYQLTDGMRYLGAGEQWSVYLISVFSGAALVLFIPGVAVGSVFPYLLRVAERSGEAGKVLGRLSAINTGGAILGSLLAGFVLLNLLGLWRSFLAVALLYFVLAAWVALGHSRKLVVAPLLAMVLALTVANPSGFPGVRLNGESERLLASWEGPDGFVSVIERDGSKRIKVNNFYSLGSSAAAEHEQNQTLIPLMPHPSPSKLFYLGMGTGITAGAGLRLPSEDVTVTELIPDVITAAAEYFNQEALGLFTQPKARVLARDGRNELRGTQKKYDAVIADLFVPWRAGVGNLYSRDHYLAARKRLNPNGVYVQWIPLYQVTDVEFWTITRTFLAAFPQVHVWRGDFYSDKSIVALVGSEKAQPLSPQAIMRNGRHLSGRANLDQRTFLALTLPFYVGNLSESKQIVPAGPIHTDNRPIIEYQAPISHRNARAGKAEWFTGNALIDFFDALIEATPPENDPYLSQLPPAFRNFVSAGHSYHKGAILRYLGHEELAVQHLHQFLNLLQMRVEFNTTSQGASSVEENN